MGSVRNVFSKGRNKGGLRNPGGLIAEEVSENMKIEDFINTCVDEGYAKRVILLVVRGWIPRLILFPKP